MNVLKFSREVKAEAVKVAWPDMKVTRQMTLMVFVLAVLMGLYLWGVDVLLQMVIQWILGA